MPRLEVGQRVGYIHRYGIDYGTIKHKFEFRDGRGIMYDVMFDGREVATRIPKNERLFPVLKGNYTEYDSCLLAGSLLEENFKKAALVIIDLYKDESGTAAFMITDSLQHIRHLADSEVLILRIDKFLDWAAHGFPAGEVWT